ncbi:peptidase inhibitor family I36 protein [Streptomyces sp. GLT-R25]
MYYNSNQEGSFAAFTRNVADLDPWIFGHIGTPNSAGQGQGVKNNAASAANPGSNCWRVYFNSNYAGASDYIGDSGYRQLVSTYNENASVKAC